jgi:hypothetical protein
MSFDGFWFGQLILSLVLAALIARMAERKGRSPTAAAILMLAFVHGWPVLTSAIGTAIAIEFRLNENARRVLARVFWAGGILWGGLWTFAIVACWKGRTARS